MEFADIHPLTLIIFLPALGALLIGFLPGLRAQVIKQMAAGFMFVSFALSIVVFALFDRSADAVQFVERAMWIPQVGISYYLGIDGLNLPMVILTSMLGFLAVFVSWKIDTRVREYFAYLLLLVSSILGVFLSLDLVLFLLFWEIEIIPMYFLISIWGHGRKDYSAIKYVIYTIFGGAMLLAGVLLLYLKAAPVMPAGQSAFDMIALRDVGLEGLAQAIPFLGIAFALLMVGFAVKLPVVPLHTWLPDAHTDAPTAVSVMLAGALLKMGGYGMIRLCVSIFPETARDYAPVLIAFAVIGVLYGAALTLRQTDLKRLIAYSSVSHMGYVLLGIFALSTASIAGATLQMFAHGIISGLLFAMCGLVYDKVHTRHIPDLGGLARQMPIIVAVFSVAGLASLGLPGTAGFAAEFITFMGAFGSGEVAGIKWFTIIAILGVVLTAGYILWMLERVFYREPKATYEHAKDSDLVENVAPFALVAVIMLVGIYPRVLTDVINVGTGLLQNMGILGP